MPRPDEKNIFETAAKKLTKKKEAPPPSQETQQSRIFFTFPKEPNIPKEVWKAQDKETQEMLAQIKAMKQDLQNKIELIQKKGAVLGGNFKSFINNEKNFTPSEWDSIQKAKGLLGDKIWNALGKTINISPGAQDLPLDAPAPPASKPGDRKGKTLGARKKWIPVR